MGFYEQISKYYDYLFPVSDDQLFFLQSCAGNPPKRILDVACGSGGYSVALAGEGHRITAVDLNTSMVAKAGEKARDAGVDMEVLQADMLKLEDELRKRFNKDFCYDLVFCIGNSIVHLGGLEEIRKALVQMQSILIQGGVLTLQIINFDRILKFHIQELPALEDSTAGLKFIRKYRNLPESGKIAFDTFLQVRNREEEASYENSIQLVPLLKEDLCKALREVGFSDIQCYGDFRGAEYREDSFLLVVKAVK